jgi:predicted nucleic acid-binding protein
VTVVADSSPLIVLAKLDCFDLLNRLFPRVIISTEVHREVVVAGAGLRGAAEVAGAQWIEVKQLRNQKELRSAQQKHALGVGELSTILIAKELHANTVLLDDYNARKLAKDKGLLVRGTLGLLETLYRHGDLTDLRAVFKGLAMHSYIDKRLLNLRLRALGFAPL